jgi:hypothetical protein
MVNRLRSVGWAGSLAIALTLVLLPLGFCLGQGSLHEGGQQAPCPALCGGALASLLIAALLGPGDLGRLPADGRRPIYVASFILSDPPPKLVPIS